MLFFVLFTYVHCSDAALLCEFLYVIQYSSHFVLFSVYTDTDFLSNSNICVAYATKDVSMEGMGAFSPVDMTIRHNKKGYVLLCSAFG